MNKIIPFNYKEFEQNVENFLQFLQIPYKNISLYTQSFVHKSVLNEKSTSYTTSNERLEFFGDAVLELVITENLYFHFPEKPEGELTDLRSAVVRGKNLATIAQELELQNYIILSKGEILASGNNNPYILANTLEAILGAIYIDCGYMEAKKFVDTFIFSTLDGIIEESLYIDPKSQLQEITQRLYNITPSYDVIEESGLDHDKNYIIGAYLREKLIGQGAGGSKKKAQKIAAQDAINNQEIWNTKK